MKIKKQCCKRVFPRERWGAFHEYNCTKPAIIERNGKWYCKIHDPEYVDAKNKEKHERWNAEAEAQREVWRRENAIRKACEGVDTDTLEKISVKELLEKIVK
jgi:ferric-dicitrate binding protein FerR (iron transport regulator)